VPLRLCEVRATVRLSSGDSHATDLELLGFFVIASDFVTALQPRHS
jgi:hypothetical protein